MDGIKVTMDADLEWLSDLTDIAKEPVAETEPPVEPTYTFSVRDKVTGKVGQFTSVVPDVKTRVAMARRQAALTGGQPWESLDFEARALLSSLVLCAFCLSEKPEWFADIMSARAHHVLLVVAEEVGAHHARWFRALAGVGAQPTYRSLVEVTGGVGGAVRAP